MKFRIFAVILLLAFSLLCVSCEGKDEDEVPYESENFYKTDIETYTIDNPVCPLQYPTQWKDSVITEVSEHQDGCTVTFTASLEGKSFPLFSLTFSETAESGSLLGVLIINDVEKNVWLVDLFDKEKTAELSDEALTQYYAMGHDVNVIISKLIYDNHMISER